MTYNPASNTHLHFLEMERVISLNTRQKKKLIASRKAIEASIVKYFQTYHSLFVPRFWIQGSAKMDTMILDRHNTYDVDLGVYFLLKPSVTPVTLQNWVYNAVANHTSDGAERRKKCVRVIYRNEFDIDLPIYYKEATDKSPFLATKHGWEKSDPKELFDWFRSKTDKNGQLKRLVKYFKAWAANKNRKMPSGITFTVWAANHFKPNERDDIAFYETAKAMGEAFFWQLNITSLNPATPKDNFLSKLNEKQNGNFRKAFKELVTDAAIALKQNNLSSAVEIWKRQFGKRFPNL